MSIATYQASNVRGILSFAIVLGLMVFLMFLAVEATQTTRVSNTQQEMIPLPATQPLEGSGSVVYGEPIGMP